LKSKLRGIRGRGTWSHCSRRSFACLNWKRLGLWSQQKFWLGIRGFSWEWSRSYKWFLYRAEFTILVTEVRIVFLFLDYFGLLCEVFWIRICKEVAIGCFSEPLITCFQLIGNIAVIIFLGIFCNKFLGISRLGPQWKISSRVFVSGLDILIVSSVSWKLGSIGTELCTWSTTMK